MTRTDKPLVLVTEGGDPEPSRRPEEEKSAAVAVCQVP